MCYFIFASFPSHLKASLRSSLPREINLAEVNNPSLAKYLPNGFATFALSTGGCACSLCLYYPEGDEPDYSVEDAQLKKDRLIAKYKKRGWSQSKIDRAIKDSIASTTSHDFEDGSSLLDTIEKCLTTLLFSSPRGIFLYVHEFSGPISEEPLPFSRKSILSPTINIHPNSVPEDTFTHFKCPAK